MDAGAITSFFLHVSLDLILVAAIGVLAFLDAMRGGSARTIALSLALPLTYILLRFVSGAQLVDGISKQFTSSLAQSLLAGLILAICFFMVYRMVDSFGSDGGFLQALAAAIGLIAMLGVFWPLIPAFAALHAPGTQFVHVFGEAYRFWWLLVGLAALAFSRG